MQSLDPTQLREQLQKSHKYFESSPEFIDKAIKNLENAQKEVTRIENLPVHKVQRDMGTLVHFKFGREQPVSP
ncbi:hypothetical protein VTP01DRAFT_238 [Rhizomucor pusillus]|uniref:uncharacterized protein n=1 Tax=Rhizomucor pusillus TaxID=4840 RepID=UPI003743225F